jgi:hypothetical protein
MLVLLNNKHNTHVALLPRTMATEDQGFVGLGASSCDGRTN